MVVSAIPDNMNTNPWLYAHLQEGFSGLLPAENVQGTAPELAISSIESFRPDLVLLFGSILSDLVDFPGIAGASKASGAHFSVWLHDDPYEFDFNYLVEEMADTIFSNDRWSVEHFTHPRVFHLPLAASPTFHYRELKEFTERQYDLFFCGCGFANRVQMIKDLSESLASFSVLIAGSEWPPDAFPARNWRIQNAEMPSYYSNSKLVLNLGRDHSFANDRYQLAASTPGPRTFEAAMAGCVQLYFVTGLEITDYFKPDSEILLFDDADDVISALEQVQRDPSAYHAIAQASQQRALRDHTYLNRAAAILKTCLGYEKALAHA